MPNLNKKISQLPDAPGVYLFYSRETSPPARIATPARRAMLSIAGGRSVSGGQPSPLRRGGELIYVGKATSLKNRVKSYWRGLPLLTKEGRGEVAFLGGVRKRRLTPPSLPLGRGGNQATRPIEEMIHEVADIKYKETDSVLEAVILEALYIKKHQPKYNVLGKDDKSWNYIVLTKDLFPRVETIRQREMDVIARSKADPSLRSGQAPQSRSKNRGIASPPAADRNDRYLRIFGPFPGLNGKETLKILRKLFKFSTCTPFVIARSLPAVIPTERRSEWRNPSNDERDSSTPARAVAQNDKRSRPCLYYEMGLCLGVCTGEISPKEYQARVVRPLLLFLAGKTISAQKYFKREMKRASKEKRYEDAAQLRDQISAFKKIQDVSLINKSFFTDEIVNGVREGGASVGARHAVPLLVTRIEGYDISNIGASDKVASMVVFENGEAKKSDYRKFIIKTVEGQSDVDCLREVIERRIKHLPPPHTPPRAGGEAFWPAPDLILVDGGRPQVNAVVETLCATSLQRAKQIPVIGMVKGRDRKRSDIIIGKNARKLILWLSGHHKVLTQVRDEAHRFAIKFHRSRRSKNFVV